MAEGVVDILEAVEIDDKKSCLALCAAGAFEGGGEPVFEEAAVGQASKFVVQSQVLVVLDLVFEQQQDHADGDDVLGQVPDLTLKMQGGPIGGEQRGQNKDHRPGEEAGDGDKGACGPATVGPEEMDAATEVEGEQECAELKTGLITGTKLGDYQEA